MGHSAQAHSCFVLDRVIYDPTMFFWPYQSQNDRARRHHASLRGRRPKNVKGEKDMKKASVLLVLLLLASASFANGTTVGWGTIVGVITAPGTSNMVAG